MADPARGAKTSKRSNPRLGASARRPLLNLTTGDPWTNRNSLSCGSRKRVRKCYRRLRRAAFAPSFPNAVRTRLGKCATVRFFRATRAAFLMFRRAALRCRWDAIRASDQWDAAESAAGAPVRPAPARADWAAQGSLAYPAFSQEDVPWPVLPHCRPDSVTLILELCVPPASSAC